MCLTWFKHWNPVKACDLHIPELHELRGWVWPYLQALACALGTFLPVVPSFFFKPREWDGDGDDDDDDDDDADAGGAGGGGDEDDDPN